MWIYGNIYLLREYNKNNFMKFALVKKFPQLNPYVRKENGSWMDWVTWGVEFLGTFLMVFMILAPAAFNFSEGSLYYGAAGEIVEVLFSTFAFKAFYVAFFIYVLVLLLRRVSANFNPAVSIVHMVRKDDSLITGFGKIAAQFAGAFAASYLAYYLSDIGGFWSSSSTLDSLVPTLQFYDWQGVSDTSAIIDYQAYYGFSIDDNMSWYWLPVVLIEAVLTFALLGSVFMGGKWVTYRGRPVVIFAVLWIIIALGIRTNNVALNPARLVAPAVVAQQFGGGAGSLEATWMFLLGEAIAIAFMSWVQLHESAKDMIERKPQNQGYFRKYIGWIKAKTKLNAAGNVVIDWDAYVVKELKHIAKELEIDNYSTMNRDELIKAIKVKKNQLKRKHNIE